MVQHPSFKKHLKMLDKLSVAARFLHLQRADITAVFLDHANKT